MAALLLAGSWILINFSTIFPFLTYNTLFCHLVTLTFDVEQECFDYMAVVFKNILKYLFFIYCFDMD